MNGTTHDTTTPPSSSNASAPIGAIVALLDRHVVELRAVASTAGERDILARIATQAIQRGLSVRGSVYDGANTRYADALREGAES